MSFREDANMSITSRRSFLKAGGAVAAAACAGADRLSAKTIHIPMGLKLPVGLQLYSVRQLLAKDFDGEVGTGMKVYINLGSNLGVKAGEYFRVFRPYEDDLHNSVDSLSFKASASEDTQRKPAAVEANWFTKTGGPVIHVRDLPRRAVAEVLVLSTTPTTSTGMIVFALEDVHIGDGVELDMD